MKFSATALVVLCASNAQAFTASSRNAGPSASIALSSSRGNSVMDYAISDQPNGQNGAPSFPAPSFTAPSFDLATFSDNNEVVRRDIP